MHCTASSLWKQCPTWVGRRAEQTNHYGGCRCDGYGMVSHMVKAMVYACHYEEPKHAALDGAMWKLTHSGCWDALGCSGAWMLSGHPPVHRLAGNGKVLT